MSDMLVVGSVDTAMSDMLVIVSVDTVMSDMLVIVKECQSLITTVRCLCM